VTSGAWVRHPDPPGPAWMSSRQGPALAARVRVRVRVWGQKEVAVTMQVALHLNDAEHEMFSRWLASTAIAVDPDNNHGPGHDRPPLISLSETRCVAALYGRVGER
jgi:hypothetical protein